MLKIQDKKGHTVAILKDKDSEPELTDEERKKLIKKLTKEAEVLAEALEEATVEREE